MDLWYDSEALHSERCTLCLVQDLKMWGQLAPQKHRLIHRFRKEDGSSTREVLIEDTPEFAPYLREGEKES